MPQNSQTIDDVLGYISATLDGIERVCFEEEINQQMIDDSKSTNTKLRTNVERIKEVIQHSVYNALVKRIEDITAKLENLVVPSGEAADTHSNIRRLPNNGKKGNSYCMIDKELLLHLSSLGFLIRRIEREGLLGGKLHHNTIFRFMKRNNIPKKRSRYPETNNNALKEKVREISSSYLNSVILEIVSHLSAANPPLIIQRSRILPEIDSVRSSRRWTQVVRRRTYRVPNPNSLWHIDTNHKLIQ